MKNNKRFVAFTIINIVTITLSILVLSGVIEKSTKIPATISLCLGGFSLLVSLAGLWGNKASTKEYKENRLAATDERGQFINAVAGNHALLLTQILLAVSGIVFAVLKLYPIAWTLFAAVIVSDAVKRILSKLYRKEM
ncbi:MAG: hypothetical protein LBN97_10200 [Oscillospiraceae bacterium]|jgi:hypothetical protein|nr:hypothetical protein [Oscillospiraceae bacterium]